MSMLDHGEFDTVVHEHNYCLETAEEMMRLLKHYIDSVVGLDIQEAKADARVIDALYARFHRNLQFPPVVVEGVDE